MFCDCLNIGFVWLIVWVLNLVILKYLCWDGLFKWVFVLVILVILYEKVEVLNFWFGIFV